MTFQAEYSILRFNMGWEFDPFNIGQSAVQERAEIRAAFEIAKNKAQEVLRDHKLKPYHRRENDLGGYSFEYHGKPHEMLLIDQDADGQIVRVYGSHPYPFPGSTNEYVAVNARSENALIEVRSDSGPSRALNEQGSLMERIQGHLDIAVNAIRLANQ